MRISSKASINVHFLLAIRSTSSNPFLEIDDTTFRTRRARIAHRDLVLEKVGKTWAKNRPRMGSKPGIEGCKSRRINNKLD